MVSFRFHLVSITAVFLAIAIGVVVGSTFVDRAIVDGLENRIDTVSANLDERRAEIADLEQRLSEAVEFTEAVAPFAVTNRLTDVPVLVLALQGADEQAVTAFTDLARQAGATVPGVLWVQPDWALDGDERREALRAATGIRGSEPRLLQRRGWLAAMEQVVAPDPAGGEGQGPTGTEAGADPSTTSSTSSSTTTVPPSPDVLAALVDAGFLQFEPVEDGRRLDELEGVSPRVVVVTGTDVDAALAGVGPRLVDVVVGAGLPLVVAETFEERDDGPERGASAVRAVPDRHVEVVAVVDHLDTVAGRITAVLALGLVTDGVTGVLGIGPSAESAVPAWSPP